MIRAFTIAGRRLKAVSDTDSNLDSAVWVDLMEPTTQENETVERWLATAVPDRRAMEEIETSSRLYSRGDIHFMTAILPAHADTDRPTLMPVTFVLAKGKLATIRYHEPSAFTTFPAQAETTDMECLDGLSILMALLDAIVERMADLLEDLNRHVIDLSQTIFHPRQKNAYRRTLAFQSILRGIGRKEGMITGLQESLVALQRLSGYLLHISLGWKESGSARERMKTVARDVKSLLGHAEMLSQKIAFLLDATLGMISIEQNSIMQIVSVATVVFLPPTLVASIYGMNFDLMPELHWRLGYPLALVLMVAAAVVPFWYFKRKGWI